MKEPEIEMSYMKDPHECQKHNYSESVKIYLCTKHPIIFTSFKSSYSKLSEMDFVLQHCPGDNSPD